MFYQSINIARNFPVRDVDTEDLTFFAAQLPSLIEGYRGIGVSVPDWLVEKERQAKTEIEARVRADKQRQLKNLKSRREANKLQTDAGLDAAIAALEKEVG